MKKTIFILLLVLLPVMCFSQTKSSSYGVKMYNNLHIVRASDTLFLQVDPSYVSLFSTAPLFLSDSVLMDSLIVREWFRADSASIDSIASTYLTDGYITIESGDIGTNRDTITLFSGAIGVDYVLAFDGESNDGSITYDEDNDGFIFNNDVAVLATLTANTFTDGVASWALSSLSGFTSISGTTLTDGVGSMNSGSLSAMVDGTFSGSLQGGTLTDGTASLTGGDLIGATYNGLTITTAANTFNLTRGTASLDLAAGVIVDFNAGLTVGTNDGTINFSAASKTLTVEDSFTGGLDLNALEALTTTGMMSRTAANTYATRTITGTANQVEITNGDGVAGNPTIGLPNDVIISGAFQANELTDGTGIFGSGSLSGFNSISGISIYGQLMNEADPYAQSLLGSAAYLDIKNLAVLDNSENLNLNGYIYAAPEHSDELAVTDDTSFEVPAGYILEYVILEETAGSTATLDLGTTIGGSDIFLNQTVTASSITTFVINKVFSTSVSQTIYLNDDDASSSWNTASVDLYVVMKKVL